MLNQNFENMTALEDLISEEMDNVRNLKLNTGASLSVWGEGYNQGIENAVAFMENALRIILLRV